MDIPIVTTWYDKPVTELSREELLEVIEHCGKEILALREDRNRWRESGDPLRYLMNGAIEKETTSQPHP